MARINLLFANTSPADPENINTLKKYQGKNKYGRGPWLWVFLEQIINSTIVGGIAALSSKVAGGGWEAAGIGFGLTFLLELRKYRQLQTPG